MGARWNNFTTGIGNIAKATGKGIVNGAKKGINRTVNGGKKGMNRCKDNTSKAIWISLTAWSIGGDMLPSGYRMPAAYVNRKNEAKIEWKNNATYDKIKTDEIIIHYFQHNDIDFEGRDIERLGTLGGMSHAERKMRYSQMAAVLIDFTTAKKINITSKDDVNKLLKTFYKSGRNPIKYLTVFPGFSKNEEANDYDFGGYNLPEDDNDNGINTNQMRNILDHNIQVK